MLETTQSGTTQEKTVLVWTASPGPDTSPKTGAGGIVTVRDGMISSYSLPRSEPNSFKLAIGIRATSHPGCNPASPREGGRGGLRSDAGDELFLDRRQRVELGRGPREKLGYEPGQVARDLRLRRHLPKQRVA